MDRLAVLATLGIAPDAAKCRRRVNYLCLVSQMTIMTITTSTGDCAYEFANLDRC